MSTNLKVPFKERGNVSALGARWDPALKVWFVPDGLDLTPFLAWVPGTKLTKEMKKVLKRRDNYRSSRSVR